MDLEKMGLLLKVKAELMFEIEASAEKITGGILTDVGMVLINVVWISVTDRIGGDGMKMEGFGDGRGGGGEGGGRGGGGGERGGERGTGGGTHCGRLIWRPVVSRFIRILSRTRRQDCWHVA